jgi:hypothetical protein
VAKQVAKFRKDKDYQDDYGFKTNTYEKKREKEKNIVRTSKYFDQYDSHEPPLHMELSRRRK